MAEASLSVRIGAAADRVWAVLAGPDMQKVIVATYAQRSEFEEAGGRVVLKTVLLDGSVVREEIEMLDSDSRCLKYRVIDSGSFPYRNYRGQMQVFELDAHSCQVVLECRYDPVGMHEDESNRLWRQHNQEVIHKIEEFLGVSRARSGT